MACGNNVDTSPDGDIDDGTTMDNPLDDGTNPGGDEQNTADGSGNVGDGDQNGGNQNDGNQNGGESTDDTNKDTNNDTSNNSQNSAPAETKRITSDTGTGINLVIEYTVGAKQGNTRTIDVTVYLESYSLNVSARGNTNYVRVGDETVYFSTEAINYDGTAKKVTRFATHTFTTDTTNSTLPIYALWNFNGVYSEKPISAIIIENTIQL